jgi:hypothetical protein
MKRGLAIAIGGILLMVALALLVSSLPQPHRETVNLGELIPQRALVPAESNGYALLMQAAALLSFSNDPPVLRRYTNWDDVAADGLLRANQSALEVERQAWQKPSLQVEAVTNQAQEFPYLSGWSRLGRLALLEAHRSFDLGRQQDGFDEVMQVMRLGQRIEGAEGAQIHYFVGRNLITLGAEYLRYFAAETTLPASNLVAVAKVLGDFEPNPVVLRNLLRTEYGLSANCFDELNTNPIGYIGIAFSADRSKRDLAVDLLQTMRALTNYYAPGVSLLPVVNTNISIGRRLWRGNIVGAILNDMQAGDYRPMLTRKCRNTVMVRATRVVLALRAFELEKHRPATSLAELVPDYLAAVPLDEFDGQPLRYSPSHQVVYSVGVCLVDGGGMDPTNNATGNILFPVH